MPDLNDEQRTIVLAALHEVASAKRSRALTAADHAALDGVAQHVLGGAAEPVDVEALPEVWPDDLSEAFDDRDLAHFVGGLRAVMPFVDGKVDDDRIGIVLCMTGFHEAEGWILVRISPDRRRAGESLV